MVTADELRMNPNARAGMSYDQLLASGMTPLEASTVAKGFSGSFTDNAAKDYRASLGLTDDQVVQSITNPSLTQYMQNQASSPYLPNGTVFNPELMQVQGNEVLNASNYMIAGAPQIGGIPQVTAQTPGAATAATPQGVNVNEVLAYINPNTGQYTPITTTAIPDMQAAQGTVNEKATVQGQLKDLYADFANGTPAWAKGAINTAEEMTAARGLGTTSIAPMAVAQAIQEGAINIAARDAATYFQMDLTNLSNEQQARLTNFQAKQQNMLTDTAIRNAAAQFNASSEMQVQQFVASLVTNIKTTNENLKSATEQFNAYQTNFMESTNAGNTLRADLANQQMELTVQQYNSGMEFQRQQFNANMASVIDQSNVQWRRSVNTANTATINAAIQTNTQNAYNLSTTSLNNLWQAFRDEAAWAFTASESEKDRAFIGIQRANAYDFESRNDPTWLSNLGSVVGTWLASDEGISGGIADVENAAEAIFNWFK